MVRDHQKCHHVVAAWTVSHNPCPDMSGSMLADLFLRPELADGYILPGFFFGLGGSGTVAYKFYLSINRQQKKENKKKKNKVSFNRHL